VLFKLVALQLDRYFQTQSAFTQNLEELKRGILDLLLPDFRLPLMSVKDYSQLLVDNLEKVQSDEELIDYLLGIKLGTTQVKQMVEDFVFLVELRTGEAQSYFKSRAKPEEVNPVVAEAMRKIILDIGTTGVNIRSQLSRSLAPVLLDYQTLRLGLDRIFNVIIRLGENRQPQYLEVLTQQQNDHVVITIGSQIGRLKTEDIDRINMLMQFDNPTSLELTTVDPGLPVAKGIIKLHRGKAVLENCPSAGYRFLIKLPVYSEA
jgi:light-regulated signal transduction histidine kinase (bacteriophytochrome)